MPKDDMFGIRCLRGVFEARSKTRGYQIRVAVFSCLLLRVVGMVITKTQRVDG